MTVSDSSSDTESDTELLREIHSLSAACTTTATTAAAARVEASLSPSRSDDDDDDDDDDDELLSEIRRKYGDGTRMERPLSLKPLMTLPPMIMSDDDDDDDLQTLKAIQRRFVQYCGERGDGGDDKGLQHSQKSNEKSHGVGTSLKDGVLDDHLVGKSNANKGRDSFNREVEETGDQATCSYAFDQSEDLISCELLLQKSTLPKAALAFIDAIKKNRSCQKFLRSKISHIEARIAEVQRLKMKVDALKQYQTQCKNKISRVRSNKEDVRAQLISAVKPRPLSKQDSNKKATVLSEGPLENSHVAKYRAALARFPQSLARERWNPKEREDLKKGIIQQYQKLLFLEAANDQSLSTVSQHRNYIDQTMSSIRDVEVTPEDLRMILPKVNWDELASMYVPRHSGTECEARWLNFEDPLLNFGNWTAQDDKNLLRTIEQRGIHNWIDIAETLQTNRTPFQCLARYQRSLNASILKSSWSPEEDDLLRSAVEDFGESNWQVVACAIEGRTGPQCSNRWKKAIHPTIEKKGRWSKEEDMRLKVGMAVLGPKWHKIAKFVPGRTQAQCRDRWVNNFDPSLNKGEWTADEDAKLREAIAEHGYHWANVASFVGSRTDARCRLRWEMLCPDEAQQLQAARDIQKTAFISNFVDRESLRPKLGPKDFLALPPPDSVSGEQNMVARRKRRKTRVRKKSNKTSSEAASWSDFFYRGASLASAFSNISKSSGRRMPSLLKSNESDAWEHSTLEELFGEVVQRIKKRRLRNGKR